MGIRIIPAGVPLVAMLLAAPAARADIYTWIDASGTLNVSNLAPPAGVQVISVDAHRDPPPAPPAPPAAALDAARDAELQALNARVVALQDEVEQARHRESAPPAYWPAPPLPQDAVYDTGDAPDHSYDAAPLPPMPASCDPVGWGCMNGWNPYAAYAYPVLVVAVNARNVRRGPVSHPVPIRPPGHAMRPPPHASHPPPPRIMAMSRHAG